MSTHNIGSKAILMSTHNIGSKAILMSTHNIGFYEDLTKIIFELSSNIIKYAPYFFCCNNKVMSNWLDPRHKKTLCFRPGLTQTRLYKHRRWQKA